MNLLLLDSDPLKLYDMILFCIVNVFMNIAINSKNKLGLSCAKLTGFPIHFSARGGMVNGPPVR